MALILILALALTGASLALVARAALLPRMRTDDALTQIAAYGYARQAATDTTERSGLLQQIAARVGTVVFRSSAEQRDAEARKLLLSAGVWNTTPAALTGYRVLAAAASGTALLWLLSSGGVAPIFALAGSTYAVVLGWRLPVFVLKSRARQRAERIELELPELIDLLVVTLEAGLGFNAALQRAAERMRGPLADEMRLALREQNLGLSLDRALRNMLDRSDAPSMRAFVRAVTQGETLGVSIGQVMRELAGDMRLRRRQLIEEKAQKAPIKMLFPLAFLILPSIFIVVLFPGMYNILETLSG
jgi:tight adherence protein C